MRYKLFVIFIITSLIAFSSSAKEIITLNKTGLDQSQKRRVLKGKTFALSVAQTSNKSKSQSFNFKIAALHPKSCSVALRKLSRYETFKNYIGFVTNSSYDDKRKLVYFRLESMLLPFSMVLQFELDRITKPGIYHFTFKYGFLKGLKGEIHVSKLNRQCFFYTKAKWSGPYTKIPSPVLEFFTEALSKIVVEKLFLISRT